VAEGVSVLVYGRNDGYGYNLARRAALSLNAIARVLADGDEIRLGVAVLVYCAPATGAAGEAAAGRRPGKR